MATLTPVSGEKSIPKNVITRSLGPNPVVDIDLEGPFPVQSGDAFLLCSDGLTGLVDDNEIGALLDCLPEDLATRVLVDLANLRGGSDNTTVIVVRAQSSVQERTNKPSESNRSTSNRLPDFTHPDRRNGSLCRHHGRAPFCSAIVAAMIMTTLLTLICGVATAEQLFRNRVTEVDEPVVSGGKGPYRSYDATPTADLYQRLGVTVQALKDAAAKNNWMMEWKKVDKYQDRGNEALKVNNAKEAIRCQAQAIIETMNQLREQNNRAANETAIER